MSENNWFFTEIDSEIDDFPIFFVNVFSSLGDNRFTDSLFNSEKTDNFGGWMLT